MGNHITKRNLIPFLHAPRDAYNQHPERLPLSENRVRKLSRGLIPFLAVSCCYYKMSLPTTGYSDLPVEIGPTVSCDLFQTQNFLHCLQLLRKRRYYRKVKSAGVGLYRGGTVQCPKARRPRSRITL